MDLLADLNDAQRQAIMHIDGPLLVLAGAGSGKTRVITRRVAYLVSQGISPYEVLAITFTNKAAGEMRDRVLALGVPRGTTVGTFHALCTRLLREFADLVGIPRQFSIYDKDDQLRVIKNAMKEAGVPDVAAPGAVLSAISRAKNSLMGPEEYAKDVANVPSRVTKVASDVYPHYQRLLGANKALDFDDLLMRTAFLMRDQPEVRLLLGRRYRYVLIDEYQDTNHAQYVIAHGIAMEHENICATGDPDQSIYAWRGANIRNILEFEQDYPNAVVVRLERNYRSVAPILAAASALIAHNVHRKRKGLHAVRAEGQSVRVVRLEDEHAEARYIAGAARQLRTQGMPYRDMAVFYRVNGLSRVLEKAFRDAGIAYQIARGVEFYARKEIKDVLAYLHLLVNPDDSVACRRIVNFPARGIGEVTIGKVENASAVWDISLLAACAQARQIQGLSGAAAGKLEAFAAMIDKLSHLQAAVPDIVNAVITTTGMEEEFSGDEEQRQAWSNVRELVSAAAEFANENPEGTLGDWLHQVALVSDIDSIDPASGAVTLMTLHAAKGLEFPAVFIAGCEEGLLPFQRFDSDGARQARDLEEERRLAFVGITRAKDLLFLTYARTRALRGQAMRQIESQFLGELGQEGVVREDLSNLLPPPREHIEPERFNRVGGAGSGRLGRRDQREYEDFDDDADRRAIEEAMEQADLLPEQFADLHPGQRVRHATFGIGRVISISHSAGKTRAEIDFKGEGRKALILEYAPPLELL